MPAPTPLDVATHSVQRLIKEETSYHKELSGQQARVAKIESEIQAGTGDENAEYVLKQEVCSSLPPSSHPCSHTLSFSTTMRSA
jgi:hypothetical protein